MLIEKKIGGKILNCFWFVVHSRGGIVPCDDVDCRVRDKDGVFSLVVKWN